MEGGGGGGGGHYTLGNMHDSCGICRSMRGCRMQSSLAPSSQLAVTPVAAAASDLGVGESWAGSGEKKGGEGIRQIYACTYQVMDSTHAMHATPCNILQ